MSSFDDIDLLIDTDPIALGERCRRAEARAERAGAALERLARDTHQRDRHEGLNVVKAKGGGFENCPISNCRDARAALASLPPGAKQSRCSVPGCDRLAAHGTYCTPHAVEGRLIQQGSEATPEGGSG